MKHLIRTITICLLFCKTGNSQDITTNLIAHYKLNANVTDATLNANNGTNSGATITGNRIPMPSTAYDFNGTDQSVIIANSTTLSSVSGSLTISLWAYIRDFDHGLDGKDYAVLVCKANNEDKADYRIAVTPNSFALVNNGYLGEISSSINIPVNKWIHLSAVFSGTNAKVFIDGVKVGEGTLNTTYGLQKNCPLTLGRDDAGGIEYFDGKLDDIRIYSRALTITDIQAVYNTRDFIIDSLMLNLIAYYPFDGNTNDYSGNGNNGIANGGGFSTDKAGNVSKSYVFAGISDYIQIANSVSLKSPVNNISMSCMVNVREFTTGIDNIDYSALICKSNSNSDAQYRLALRRDGLSVINNGKLGNIASGPALITNQWYHITAVISNDTLKYYLNGQYVGKTYLPFSFTLNDNNPLYIGKDDPGGIEYFNGKLDEIRIYSRALTASDISRIYAISNTTSITKVINNDNNIVAFPNPANKLVYLAGVELNTNQLQITAYTLEGKEIECEIIKENSHVTLKFPDNMFTQMILVKIQSETSCAIKKIHILSSN